MPDRSADDDCVHDADNVDRGRDDLAYAQGTYTMTIAAPGEPKPIEASGYFIEIAQRQQDGRWLMAVHMLTANS